LGGRLLQLVEAASDEEMDTVASGDEMDTAASGAGR
jgi:hypothetical protein